jgi:hypothetical protein
LMGALNAKYFSPVKTPDQYPVRTLAARGGNDGSRPARRIGPRRRHSRAPKPNTSPASCIGSVVDHEGERELWFIQGSAWSSGVDPKGFIPAPEIDTGYGGGDQPAQSTRCALRGRTAL